jgi:hypothetical protein
MKKIFFILLIVSYFPFLQAQISQGGSPRGLDLPSPFSSGFPTYYAGTPDFSEIEADIANASKNGTIYPIGRAVPLNINTETHGTWEDLPEGGSLWRLGMVAPGARALGLSFHEFLLPFGSELFIYSSDQKQVIGAFSSDNNPVTGIFATEPIHGDSLIVELFSPQGRLAETPFIITEAAYIYRAFRWKSTNDFGDSEYCEVNINCSPEGNNWQDEKKGVCRILLKVGAQYGWCSGSLVNNTLQNFVPYVLTADHCGENASTADLNQWIFYFNYEALSCNDPGSQPASNTMTGATKKAAGGNGGDTGSDFYLVQLNQSVPLSYNLYFNGWNRSTTATAGGVSIHHPAGDIKKISTFSITPISGSWATVSGTHWKVQWIATTNGYGVTEGGSSGSPLFDSNGRIIGDLTGGGSYCSTPTAYDYYGKFSYSWQSNGTTNTTQLKPWLDPNNSGVTTLNGTYQVVVSFTGLSGPYCANAAAISLTGTPSGGSFSGTGVSGNTFSPQVSGPGTFTITYTSSSGSSSQQVTVNPLPIVNLGPDQTVNAPQAVTLNAGSGGTSFIWSTGQTSQTIVISDIGSSIYSVTVTNSNGCQASDQITVTINPAIGISGLASPYCVDHSPVLLTGSPAGGSFSGPGILGSYFSPSLAGPGSFSIQYVTTLGSTEATVIVHPLPGVYLGNDTSLTTPQTLILNAGNSGSTYQWSSGQTSQSITLAAPGINLFSVTVTTPAGCSGSDEILVSIIPGPPVSPGWTFTNTGSNHTILIPANADLTVDGQPLVAGDFIGVFFDSLGTPACGGFIQWQGVSDALSAWGFDANLGGDNGFVAGESFQWKVWRLTTNQVVDATVSYNTIDFPHVGIFFVNGISGIVSLSGSTFQNQTIFLPAGWDYFSTYINPTQPNISQVLSSISGTFAIVKSGSGDIFWPVFSINNIGNMEIGKGYQIKMISKQFLVVTGQAIIPETTPIEVPQGWSLIGYLRQTEDPVALMLNSILPHVSIVKNDSGGVYWPLFGVNSIQNLIPGEGYQIRTSSAAQLTYPAN